MLRALVFGRIAGEQAVDYLEASCVTASRD
jgi:hypothetical protein